MLHLSQLTARHLFCTGFLSVLLAMPPNSFAAPSGAPPIPPASFPEDVVDAISDAGGPDFSGAMRFEQLNSDGGRSYVSGLDADGNPVSEGGTHIIRVYLSYFSGGDSGSGWYCSIEIIDPQGEITNAADSHPDSDYLADLKESSKEAIYTNDPAWSKQFEKELPRTKSAAIKEAFKRLNQGLRGKVRLTMQRGKNGHGVRVGGRSKAGPN